MQSLMLYCFSQITDMDSYMSWKVTEIWTEAQFPAHMEITANHPKVRPY